MLCFTRKWLQRREPEGVELVHKGCQGCMFDPFRVSAWVAAFRGFHPRLFTFDPFGVAGSYNNSC
jgi:20S proteasome alpha/beta subunit